MKKCLIISGGNYSKLNIDRSEYFVVACDKGYEYAKRDDIIPDMILGDFDSYDGVLPDDIEVIKLPKEKDDTDTMYAIRTVIEKGYDDIQIRCALGGRKDHEFANYQTVAFAISEGAKCSIISDEYAIYGIKDGSISLECKEGQNFSVFALSDECEGVTIRGAHYEVENVCLKNTFPIGQSNYAEKCIVDISVKKGMLLVMKIIE